MNEIDRLIPLRKKFEEETNYILHDYDEQGYYEKGFHIKYVEWLESKVGNKTKDEL